MDRNLNVGLYWLIVCTIVSFTDCIKPTKCQQEYYISCGEDTAPCHTVICPVKNRHNVDQIHVIRHTENCKSNVGYDGEYIWTTDCCRVVAHICYIGDISNFVSSTTNVDNTINNTTASPTTAASVSATTSSASTVGGNLDRNIAPDIIYGRRFAPGSSNAFSPIANNSMREIIDKATPVKKAENRDKESSSAQDRLYMADSINNGGRTRENPGTEPRVVTGKLSHIPTLAEPETQIHADGDEMAVIRNVGLYVGTALGIVVILIVIATLCFFCKKKIKRHIVWQKRQKNSREEDLNLPVYQSPDNISFPCKMFSNLEYDMTLETTSATKILHFPAQLSNNNAHCDVIQITARQPKRDCDVVVSDEADKADSNATEIVYNKPCKDLSTSFGRDHVYDHAIQTPSNRMVIFPPKI